MAFCHSFPGSMILSDCSKAIKPVIVISLRTGSNFFSFTDEDFGIHFFPDLTIFNNWASVGSSSMHVAINDMLR